MIVLVALSWFVAYLLLPGGLLYLSERPNRRRDKARSFLSYRPALIIFAGYFTGFLILDLFAFRDGWAAFGHFLCLGIVAWFNYRRVTRWAPLRAERRSRDNHERLP